MLCYCRLRWNLIDPGGEMKRDLHLHQLQHESDEDINALMIIIHDYLKWIITSTDSYFLKFNFDTTDLRTAGLSPSCCTEVVSAGGSPPESKWLLTVEKAVETD